MLQRLRPLTETGSGTLFDVSEDLLSCGCGGQGRAVAEELEKVTPVGVLEATLHMFGLLLAALFARRSLPGLVQAGHSAARHPGRK